MMRIRSTASLQLISAVSLCAVMTTPVTAALLASESFEYTPGTPVATGVSPGPIVDNLNGGMGFGSNAWKDFSFVGPTGGVLSNDTVAASGLTYTGLLTSGSALSVLAVDQTLVPDSWGGEYSNTSRSVPGTPFGAMGTNLWVSFLYRLDDASSDYAAFTLGDGPNSGKLSVNAAQGQPFALGAASAAGQTSGGPAIFAGVTHLVVLHVAFNVGNDAIALYVDPTLGSPLGTPSATLNTINIRSDQQIATFAFEAGSGGGGFTFDELRVGESFADVTPIPEPASIGMIAGSFILLATRRRRVGKCR